jgi:tetratricopeptide (TPR) repeat protein
MRPALSVLAVALACVACPLEAAAQDTQEPAPETADSLYNQGNEAYDREDFKLAFELYTGAFKLRPSYDIARNLGLVELKLGRFKDAVGHLSYSVALYPSNRADTKAQVVEWLEQAKTEVGTLALQVSPEAAECYVNGAAMTREERDEDIVADPGGVKVECRAKGYRTEKRTVRVEKGRRVEETITLAVEPQVPRGGQGTPGGGAGSRMVLVWAGAAAAVTGLGVGAAMGVLSLVKASEADDMLGKLRSSSTRDSPCAEPKAAGCEELYALRREQDAFGNVAFWTLIAGGVASAGTTFYGFMTQPPQQKVAAPRTAVVPLVAPGTAGVVLVGSF